MGAFQLPSLFHRRISRCSLAAVLLWQPWKQREDAPPRPLSVPLELYLPKPFFLSSPPLCPCFLGLFRRHPLSHTNDVLLHLHPHARAAPRGGTKKNKNIFITTAVAIRPNETLVCQLCVGPLSLIMNSVVTHSSHCNQIRYPLFRLV